MKRKFKSGQLEVYNVQRVIIFATFFRLFKVTDFPLFQTNDQNCGTKSLPILEEEEKVKNITFTFLLYLL